MRRNGSWERMGIPEGYEDHKLMAGHLHEPRSPELPREPRPMDSENCEAGCHITCLLRTWFQHSCRHLLASGLDRCLNSEMECDWGRSVWEKRPVVLKRMCRGERIIQGWRWKSKLWVEEDKRRLANDKCLTGHWASQKWTKFIREGTHSEQKT